MIDLFVEVCFHAQTLFSSFRFVITRSGTSTWKPSVTLVGDVPKPRPISAIYDPQPVTKTSLAHSQPVSEKFQQYILEPT